MSQNDEMSATDEARKQKILNEIWFSEATPEPLETVTLHFNYEPSVLRLSGIDIATSEGKAQVKACILLALEGLQMNWAGCDEEEVDLPNAEALAVADSLLAEGP